MHKKIFNAVYALNIFFQGFFSLVFPAGLFSATAWLLVSRAGAPVWIYAPFILIGVLLGFYSMIKFILSAFRTLEALEKEQKEKEAEKEK